MGAARGAGPELYAVPPWACQIAGTGARGRGEVVGSAPIAVVSPTEDSPSGLWRSLGMRVGSNPSGVQIPHPPPLS